MRRLTHYLDTRRPPEHRLLQESRKSEAFATTPEQVAYTNGCPILSVLPYSPSRSANHTVRVLQCNVYVKRPDARRETMFRPHTAEILDRKMKLLAELMSKKYSALFLFRNFSGSFEDDDEHEGRTFGCGFAAP